MAEPVDSVALVISHCLANGELAAVTQGRIAGAHRFSQADGPDGEARGWPAGGRALTFTLAGGDGFDTISCPDAAQERVRLEYRAWGLTTVEATIVAGWLAHLVRRHTRALVTLPDGREALLFVLAPAEAPRAETDPDTGYPTLRGALRVHHQAMA